MVIQIALLGCGAHSEGSHAVPLARYAAKYPGRVELAAVCDRQVDRAETFRRRFGFARAYSEAGKMFDTERLDGCVAVMPIPAIAQTAAELFRRKIPCSIEKPPGASIEEMRSLAQLARETGAEHLVSVNRRFIPRLNRALAWAREQGPIRFVRGAMLRVHRPEPGFIWETGLHAVDAFRHIAGEVQSFEGTRLDRSPLSAPWYAIAFRFAEDCAGRLEIFPTTGYGEETYEIAGEGWIARVTSCGWEGHGENTLHAWSDGKLVIEDVAPPEEPPDVSSGAYAETEAFLNALVEGRPLRPTLADILPSVEICFALNAL